MYAKLRGRWMDGGRNAAARPIRPMPTEEGLLGARATHAGGRARGRIPVCAVQRARARMFSIAAMRFRSFPSMLSISWEEVMSMGDEKR